MLAEHPCLHPNNPHTPPMDVIKGMIGHGIVPLLLAHYSLSEWCAKELSRVLYTHLASWDLLGLPLRLIC